ncbi:DUF6765 family protein [Massilia sp. Se16.2.3]|uniref:DUF6765 family protein n=1 Tax=Massilia sp. Se16.2.3 TaxID=2709303 RepID=UPI0015FFF571|nr:DUF6765 family protein [Massilia sp. Se16.2.3]QNA99625.1 RHS repeat protein [Massilia sp. Se16.2.3]
MSKTNVSKATRKALLSALLLTGGTQLVSAEGIPGFGDPPSGCGVTMSCPGTPTPPIIPPGTTPPGTHPPGTCGPGNGGATCSATGAAVNPSAGNGEINVGAGNPINIINGNKYQREVDMAPLPGVLGLEIVRHYNSSMSGQGASTNLVGRGWKLSYETDLYVVGRTVQIVQADGSRIIFNRDPRDASLCASNNPADGKIVTRKTSKGEEYVWRWTNGRELSFDSRGKLVQILAPGGQFVSLQHDARGMLVSVTDPQGRRLQLQYLDKAQSADGISFRGVQSIVSPVGTFRYHYGSPVPKGADVPAKTLLANLVKVEMPTGARYYHYESRAFPTYLTGISELAANEAGKVAWQRVSTYGYDDNGKGNLSVKGYPARLARGADGKPVSPARLVEGTGVQQITLEHGAGMTTLTNSLGQKTVYRHAIIGGQYRLLEAIGAGCVTCGESNVRYGYDADGRLVATTKLDVKGVPLSTESTRYDAQGRPSMVVNYAYANGKALAGKLKMRLEYAGDSESPARIIRPSVVPGKEVVTEIAYVEAGAAQGMPASISERGFLPTYEGTGVAGVIERRIGYRYDGYGQRVEVDGPLPNAAGKADPSNSDISRTVYDARTKMPLRTVAPGNVVTEFLERDTALRLTATRTVDAAGSQTVSIRHNWRGQPEEVRIDSALADGSGAQSRTIRYSYGPNGRLLSVTQPGNLISRFIYDVAGRITHRILPDGSKLVAAVDTEGRQQEAATYTAQDQLTGRAQFDFNAGNRVAATGDGLGAQGSVSYTDAGQVARLTNALGIGTQFDYDAYGQLTSATIAAGTADASTIGFAYDVNGKQIKVTDAKGVTTLRRYDDFGRKMFEVNGDRGIDLFYYDPAGRLIVRSDGRGTTTRFTYDLQGHMLSAGSDKIAGLMQYRYLGRRLMEVLATPDGKAEHATERTLFRYDAVGQVLEERRIMARVDAAPGQAPLEFVTASEYDEAGRLLRQTLPDGHSLAYRYATNGGQLEAVLFDDEALVTDIQQSVAGGLTGYTHANGVQQRIALDARGRMTELAAVGRATGETSWWTRVMAWFGKEAAAPRVLYSQANRYDAADRLTAIMRQLGATGPRAAQTLAENYGYDARDQLTTVADGHGATLRYTYDKGGNRTAEQGGPVLTQVNAGKAGQAPATRTYLYAEGSNRLTGTARAADGAGGQVAETGLFYRPGGVPMARIGFMPTLGQPGIVQGRSNRIEYNAARRPIAVYGPDGKLVAAYRYNANGERSAKTVYAASASAPGFVRTSAVASPKGLTTYSLYRDQRLAAEADSEGHIRTHYIYLHGKPLAKIEMSPDVGWLHSLRKSLFGGQDSVAHVYAIHTDHLGTPQAVSNSAQQIVWQASTTAFGKAQILHAALSAGSGNVFEMNLRMPGQVYDAETGLSQNYLRDYDPELGRYTTPDPLGLEGGINPYVYVGSNPLTRIDPLGLYQSDIHYYMTMFLGIAAGLTPEEARIVALAAQFVDDNEDTEPMNLDHFLSDDHRTRLLTYHFTAVESHVDPATGKLDGQLGHYGDPPDSPAYINIPLNAQLNRLENAAELSQFDEKVACKRGARLQLMGEFLHSFADSFAHRDSNNMPFPLEVGIGHGGYGSNPDYTYDHYSLGGPGGFNWDSNEARTLQMEREMYVRMKNIGGTGAAKTLFDADFESFLKEFNDIHEHEGAFGNGYNKLNPAESDKIQLLQSKLNEWGVTEVNWTNPGAPYKGVYSKTDGLANRNKYLCDANGHALDQKLYQGTILPTCNP